MIETLPFFMRKSKVYQEIFKADETQVKGLDTNIEDLKAQLNIDTATWMLDVYEKEAGIKTDSSKPYSERRSVIRSKWRGQGKVDAQLLKIVADSYTNGEVIVSFNGVILITFTSHIGRPPNLEDVKEAIENTKPAHLRVEYEFRYLTINEVSQMTINELLATKLENFAGGVS